MSWHVACGVYSKCCRIVLIVVVVEMLKNDTISEYSVIEEICTTIGSTSGSVVFNLYCTLKWHCVPIKYQLQVLIANEYDGIGQGTLIYAFSLIPGVSKADKKVKNTYKLENSHKCIKKDYTLIYFFHLCLILKLFLKGYVTECPVTPVWHTRAWCFRRLFWCAYICLWKRLHVFNDAVYLIYAYM